VEELQGFQRMKHIQQETYQRMTRESLNDILGKYAI
jgi:hypothetical protein